MLLHLHIGQEDFSFKVNWQPGRRRVKGLRSRFGLISDVSDALQLALRRLGASSFF